MSLRILLITKIFLKINVLSKYFSADVLIFSIFQGGVVEPLNTNMQERLVHNVIEPMAKDGLRTISLAYRDFVPGKADKNQVSEASFWWTVSRDHNTLLSDWSI